MIMFLTGMPVRCLCDLQAGHPFCNTNLGIMVYVTVTREFSSTSSQWLHV